MKQKTIIKRYCTPQEAAEIYGLSVGTLANLRYQKRGAKYFILGNIPGKRRKVLYFIEDLESWIRQNPVLTVDSLPEGPNR